MNSLKEVFNLPLILKKDLFKNILLIERGGSPRPIEAYLTDNQKGINWIKISDTNPNDKYIYKAASKIKEEGITQSKYIIPGDLLLSNSMSYGRPYISKIEGCIHDGWLLIRDEKEIFDKEYLCYLLTTPKIINEYNKKASRGVVSNLNKDLVENLEVCYPDKEIQKRIAKFLLMIDRKINLLNKKIKTLSELKEELIKKYYLIHKDDWAEKKIKDLFELKRGSVTPKNSIEIKQDQLHCYPVYSAQTSNEGIMGYSKEYQYNGKYITWTTDGANAGMVFYRNGQFSCTNVCGILIAKKEYEYLNSHFFAWILNNITPQYVSYIGNAKLMIKIMAEIKINMPTDFNEIELQIINFKNRISKEKEKVVSLEKFKNYFLENLFE